MEEIKLLTIKEFADATGRFPNQIYDLINKGNRFRKLKCVIDPETGKKKVPESEVSEYPFNTEDKIRMEFDARFEELEDRVAELEAAINAPVDEEEDEYVKER